jgi:branched-chain amino acid transport system substrate-binding protein
MSSVIRMTSSAVLALHLLAGAPAALAEPGVSATEIRIGMANAQSGPAAALGAGIKKGSGVYFDRINKGGGVHGRKITLLSEDDGYEPGKTVAATEKLVTQDQVFALFGYVGTPTSKVAIPIAARNGVPFFAPFTGADFLRTPVDKWVFNVRASYSAEIEMQVDRLIADVGAKRFALFIQDDAYGVVGKEALERALRKRQMAPVAEGRYKRNTEDVDAALALLKEAKPEAVLMVGTYKACAAFVKKAKASGFTPKLLNLSFVGTSDYIKAAGADGENTYITQVLPSPDDASAPIVRQYQADMKAAGFASFDYTSLEGYVSAAVLVEALKANGAELTRQSLLTTLEKMKVNVGGLDVSFSPSDHQGLKKVYITKVQGGKAVPVSKL